MTMRLLVGGAAAVALACLGVLPAHAGTAKRAWVSGHGVDQAGCGSPAAPCRSLQYTHDNIAGAGGEIDILDPAGYGALTITKAISIVNDGVGTAGVQASTGNAITINAGAADTVYLKGLNVDGQEFAGANGIRFNSGGALTVENCTIRHFSANGIQVAPTAGPVHLALLHTSTLQNQNNGIEVDLDSATIDTVIDHAISNDNNVGVLLLQTSSAAPSSRAAITNLLANHDGIGAEVNSQATLSLSIAFDFAILTNNTTAGLTMLGTPDIVLSRSLIHGNHISIDDEGSTKMGSFGDNRIYGNDIDGAGITTFSTRSPR